MQQASLMRLKILLPFRIFAEKTSILRIVADTRDGSFGLLPNRLDCVAAISPGIFMYEDEGQGETFLAVDEGVLVKAGLNVVLSVRNAIGDKDLSQLHLAVERDFLNLNDEEKKVRAMMGKMESGFISRLARFHSA